MRILHVFDHSIPLHSGYTFRSAAILREQRGMGWQTFHLTGPKHVGATEPEEDVDGLHFFRTPADYAGAQVPGLGPWLLMRRLELDPERMMDRPDDIFLTPLIDYWSDENRQAMEHSSQQARAQASAAGTVSDDVQEPEAEFLPYSGCVWAYGFLTAVDDFSADWPDPSMHGDREAREDAETYFALLELINALTQDPSSKHYQAFAASQWSGEPPTREELVQEVCFAVQDLRFHWLNHAAKPAPRHVEAAPGRNEPCPCGSGKKFKKCHGGVG